jgi:hypothetical protein
MQGANKEIKDRRNSGGRGNRQNPRGDYSAGNIPSDGTCSLNRADARDGTGNSVGAGHRKTEPGCEKYGDGSAGFRAETAAGPQTSEPGAHRPNNSPASAHRAKSDSGAGSSDHPCRNMKIFLNPTRDKHGSNYSHCFLGVIRSMGAAEKRGRDELITAKVAIHLRRSEVSKSPLHRHHEQVCSNHSDEGRKDEKGQRDAPLSRNQRRESGLGKRRPGIPADQRVGRTRGQ